MDKTELLVLGLIIDKECAPKIRKNLETGIVFPFYRIFKNFEPSEPSLDLSKKLPSNFFMDKAGAPKISISAVVGRNGGGKSTLIDIVVRLLNNLSFKFASQYPEFPTNNDFSFIKGIRATLYFSVDSLLCRLKQYGDKTSELVVEYYEDGGWKSFPQNKTGFGRWFFYTILLNYSLFAFNTNDYEDEVESPRYKSVDWLNACFHKNDGYFSPLTLNPYREKGIIDINNETHLAKSRLISLIFDSKKTPIQANSDLNAYKSTHNPYTYINKRHSISSIRIKFDSESVDRKYDGIFRNWRMNIGFTLDTISSIHNAIVKEWRKIYKFKDVDDALYACALSYLVYKTVSVANKYNAYDHFYALAFNHKYDSIEERIKDIHELIKEINKDKSHITFRLRQTLAFLVNRQYDAIKNGWTEFQIEDFSKILDKVEDIKAWDMVDLVPPPIFETQIVVEDNITHEKFSFNNLSSGERQLSYLVSTILYHLKNIDSVPANNKRRIKYSHANVVLDEVELYFHPGYQRKFIKHIIDCLKLIELNSIQSINFLIVTHSPFILSDIPKSNVLFLKDGHPDFEMQENTFAANIHSILRNGFFLEDGTMGEFAKEKVNELFRILHEVSDGDEFDSELRKNILLVSEPILRTQLLRMYNELYGDSKKLKKMMTLINELSSEIRSLKNDRNRN